MRAIIPVAGVGSRLRPHTYSLPKVLLNVAGKPIIGHILDKIIADGFDSATIIVGYLGEKIMEYVRQNYTINIEFLEQEERKGLAHAISLARHHLTGDPVLIILGDTIFDVDLKPVLQGNATSIGVKYVEDPRRFGIAEVGNGSVTRLVEKPEKPTSNLAIVGLYWVRNPKLLDTCIEDLFRKGVKTRGEFQLTDALQLMVERGERITTFPVEGWYDCGKPETLLETNRHLLEKQHQPLAIDGVVIVPPVYVAPSAKISNSVIGPFVTIAEGATVEEAVIRNSIVSGDAEVYKTLLDNSIIGNSAVVRGRFRRMNVGDSSEIDFY
jgi:glucose-1-phosphate thymidylyltransferase